MANEKQIEQPYPMAPGDIDDFFWDWTKRLAAGASIATLDIQVEGGVTKVESEESGGIVRALLAMGEAVELGAIATAYCTMTTDQTPARHLTRAITFVAKKV